MKVVLAYSGGLDTSVILQWIKEEYGADVTLADCVETGVQRTSACSLTNLTCAPLAGAYLWGCLEAAPFDPSFCNAVPDAEDNEAVIDWAGRACTVPPTAVGRISTRPNFSNS